MYLLNQLSSLQTLVLDGVQLSDNGTEYVSYIKVVWGSDYNVKIKIHYIFHSLKAIETKCVGFNQGRIRGGGGFWGLAPSPWPFNQTLEELGKFNRVWCGCTRI